ncbi:probable glutamate receptor [Hetaerina americana]|uniref:probable glutamate receptor n=1 Tax=Hetaerina americana TaxID=62018 RepID=UPI003A7F2BBB
MIQLVCIIKKYFNEFAYITLNFNNWLEKGSGRNGSKVNTKVLRLTRELLVLEENLPWKNGVVHIRRRFNSEGRRKNITKRRTMLGVNIPVTTLYNPPMSMLKRNGSKNILTGYIGDIWHDIQDILKFSYSVHSSEEDKSISHNSKCCLPTEGEIECTTMNCHTWSDLVGQLMRGEADVVTTPLTLTPERLVNIHFSPPILFTSEQLFIRLSSSPPVSYDFYLQPFSPNIWFMIVFIFMCILPMMYTLIFWLSPSDSYPNIPDSKQDDLEYHSRNNLPLSYKIVDTVSDWLMESFGIFCQQGLQFVPQSQAVRLSLYVTMLTSSVIYNVYSGSLTSFLTVDRQIKPQFGTMENLLHYVISNGLSIGVLDNSSLISVLSEQSSGPYKEIWDIVCDSNPGLVPTRFEGFHRACHEDFVFFTMKDSYEGYRKFLQPCELYGIPESNLNTYVGISIRKGYEYAELLDDILLRMNEAGMLHRQRLIWWPPYSPEEYTYAAAQKDAVETGTADPIMKITIGHITFAIELLICGICLSLVIFLCEKMSTCQGWRVDF